MFGILRPLAPVCSDGGGRRERRRDGGGEERRIEGGTREEEEGDKEEDKGQDVKMQEKQSRERSVKMRFHDPFSFCSFMN